MAPDTPVHSLDECFEYLARNQWQFKMLETQSPVKINAQMLRSLYFHIGCAKFGVPFSDNLEQLGAQFALAHRAQKGGMNTDPRLIADIV